MDNGRVRRGDDIEMDIFKCLLMVMVLLRDA